jgi:hypothetical protein
MLLTTEVNEATILKKSEIGIMQQAGPIKLENQKQARRSGSAFWKVENYDANSSV